MSRASCRFDFVRVQQVVARICSREGNGPTMSHDDANENATRAEHGGDGRLASRPRGDPTCGLGAGKRQRPGATPACDKQEHGDGHAELGLGQRGRRAWTPVVRRAVKDPRASAGNAATRSAGLACEARWGREREEHRRRRPPGAVLQRWGTAPTSMRRRSSSKEQEDCDASEHNPWRRAPARASAPARDAAGEHGFVDVATPPRPARHRELAVADLGRGGGQLLAPRDVVDVDLENLTFGIAAHHWAAMNVARWL